MEILAFILFLASVLLIGFLVKRKRHELISVSETPQYIKPLFYNKDECNIFKLRQESEDKRVDEFIEATAWAVFEEWLRCRNEKIIFMRNPTEESTIYEISNMESARYKGASSISDAIDDRISELLTDYKENYGN